MKQHPTMILKRSSFDLRCIAVGLAVVACFVAQSMAVAQSAGNRATPVDRIKAAKGFQVELLYSVPANKQGSWVAICVDDKGRFYASDQYGGLYRFPAPPPGQPLDPKTVETVPAEIRAANGMHFADGALYVGVNDYERKIPSGFYKLTDSDGDDRLDKVELLREMGPPGGHRSGGDHGLHGVVPVPGSDDFYLICGNRVAPTASDPTSPVPAIWGEDHLLPRMPDGFGHNRTVPAPGGMIYRVSRDGKSFSLIAAGFRNIYDASVNHAGELFTYDSDMEWDMNTPWYRPARVNHVVSGGEFGWRNGTGKRPEFYADNLPATLNIGPGSPTSMTFGYGAKFPANYQKALFILDWSWGKVYAVHLKPKGASYTAVKEDFLSGAPLPVTDVVIHPRDGAMYFAIGGRRVQSGLYRVTYTGNEDTSRVGPDRSLTAEAKLRHELEAFHGKPDPRAIEAAWPHLSHPDRHIRWAARTAIEHQPIGTWKARALAEPDPAKQIESLLALSRVGGICPYHRVPPRPLGRAAGKPAIEAAPLPDGATPTPPADTALRDEILGALIAIDFDALSPDSRRALVRTVQITLNRFDGAEEATTKKLIADLDPAFPAKSFSLNRLLCETLAYLQSPTVAEKAIALIEAAPTQEEQVEYARSIRMLEAGWTDELHKSYFEWFLKAANYRGGRSFERFVQSIRKDAVTSLSESQKESLKEILAKKPVKKSALENLGSIFAGRTETKWTLDELSQAARTELKHRDFANGRRMFAAAGCFACHRLRDQGGVTGPDLTSAGRRYSSHDLLDQVIHPSKVINDQYSAVTIVTEDGRVHTGVVVNLSSRGYMLNTDLADPNQRVNIDPQTIEELMVSKTSPMPAGLFNRMTKDEILDLTAYLISGGDSQHDYFRRKSQRPNISDLEFFESRIRPVLVEHCYECHNSSGKAKGGLALDYKAALRAGGKSGKVIVPGQPDKSILIWALRHENDYEMPAKSPKLDDAIIRDFEKWVKMGAQDPRLHEPPKEELAVDSDWPAIFERRKAWWSFQPVTAPKAPAGENAIDGFVQSKLIDAKLTPANPASPTILVRRIYFNLIGLPPTPEQIAAFESAAAEDRDAATQNLVDELLESPRFGEKWARHWMDWIRYAETHGSEGDPRIPGVTHYRDYLIRALNADIPYDQLVREHIAGDLLEKPRINAELKINESLIATAHWRMVYHAWNPTDPLDERVRFTDDQINAFSKAFLGLTVSCARCHDHKFDAISQADFHALYSIFSSTRPSSAPIQPVELLETHHDELRKLKDDVRIAIAQDWKNALEGFQPRELEEAQKPGHVLQELHLLRKLGKTRGSDFAQAWKNRATHWRNWTEPELPEGSIRHDLSDPDTYANWFAYGTGMPDEPTPPGEFAIRAEGDRALHGIFPAGVISNLESTKHAAILTSPDIHLDGEYELRLLVAGAGDSSAGPVIQNYPRGAGLFRVTRLTEKKNALSSWHWDSYVKFDYWDGDDIHIELAGAKDAPLKLGKSQRSWFGLREAILIPKDLAADYLPAENQFVRAIYDNVETAPSNLNEALAVWKKAILTVVEAWGKGAAITNDYALLLDAALAQGILPNRLDQLDQSIAVIQDYRKLEADVPFPQRIATIAEWRGQDQPLFERGNHKKPTDEIIPRRFLEAIDSTPYETKLSGRLELAEDVLREDNPFARRVIVNRIWHHLFGRGIVATADNLGRMGEKPSHPELLDYLARRFSDEQNWSLKPLIRSIVLTDTWQQASDPTSESKEADPDNALLSHYSLRRLEAEAISDSILAVSGQIAGKNRRAVYHPGGRNEPNEFLASFGFPTPLSTVGVRLVTNVPAQSLMMMNNNIVTDAAGRLHKRSRTEEDAETVRNMWMTALGREPEESEIASSVDFVQRMLGTRAEREAKRIEFQRRITALQSQRCDILAPVRKRLEAEVRAKQDFTGEQPVDLKPMLQWDFEASANDLRQDLGGRLAGTARLEDGALVLDGKGTFFSEPLDRKIRAKTLEVLVQLNNLNQRTVEAMTIQRLPGPGEPFDAVAFGQLQPRQWAAGSLGNRRTEDFGGEPEEEANQTAVRITIAYDEDGTIRGYRNGRPLGETYRKAGLQPFGKNEAQIVFGRFLASKAQVMRLQGLILEAAFYDRALTAEEVAASHGRTIDYLAQANVIAALTEAQRTELEHIDASVPNLEQEISNLGPPMDEDRAWTMLAHTILNMKEFIYVR